MEKRLTPISFSIEADLPISPQHLFSQIADVERWPEFEGWGPLPGVRSAVFEVRTADVVGSRIRVVNTDGSRHAEDVEVWSYPGRITLKLHAFTPPLSSVASHFIETWDIAEISGGIRVIRSFELYPQHNFTRPVLHVISFLFKQAIRRHLAHISAAQQPSAG